MFRSWAAAVAVLVFVPAASYAQFVMMPDSTNNRIVLFDPFDGSVLNTNYFGLAGGTPLHAMQVGNEIWVSEQIGDRLSRWDLTGGSLGAVSGGLDNVRGMGLIGGKVYATNAGTGNGAPGNAIVSFDTNGNPLGNFSTVGLAPSPFSILESTGGMLVGSSSANDDIHEFTLSGTSVRTFHNSTSLNFVEQLDYDAAGNVLAASFSSNIVATLNLGDGSIMSSFPASGARGVYQLGNGNILWSNGSGAFVFNTGSGGSTQVYTGGGRYFDDLVIPEPGSFALLSIAGLALVRRRR